MGWGMCRNITFPCWLECELGAALFTASSEQALPCAHLPAASCTDATGAVDCCGDEAPDNPAICIEDKCAYCKGVLESWKEL